MAARPTRRRHLLAATSFGALGALVAQITNARVIHEALPWSANEAYPPAHVVTDTLQFFTPDEAATIAAMASRLIPADELGPGGGEAGCAIFLDRQLAGPYGRSEWLYNQGPFVPGTPQQGPQDEHPPAVRYRAALAAITAHCKANFAGQPFAGLSATDQDALLTALEAGRAGIAQLDEKPFFEMLLQNVMEGFFADPTYGGNRDMVGWKLVGFPGVRYDFLEMLDRPNQPYTEPPVGLRGRPAWSRS